MDAVEKIIEHLDVNKILTHYRFDKVRQDGDMIRSCCKIHDGDNATSFVINDESGLWFCHTGGCGGGDIFTLVQRIEDVDFPSSVRILSKILNVDIHNLTIVEHKQEYVKELQRFIQAMKKKKKHVEKEYTFPDVEIKLVTSYRRFNLDTLQHFALGFVERLPIVKRDGEEGILRDRLIFPIIQDGKTVGISTRRTKARDMPKWLHQPANIKTANLLYNFDSMLDVEEIVVVEGILDVWAYHEIGISAVCTYGAHVTEEQYRMLMCSGKNLCFSFDGDDAGRKATRDAQRMFKHKANYSIVTLPEGSDPESIPREKLEEYHANRRRYY